MVLDPELDNVRVASVDLPGDGTMWMVASNKRHFPIEIQHGGKYTTDKISIDAPPEHEIDTYDVRGQLHELEPGTDKVLLRSDLDRPGIRGMIQTIIDEAQGRRIGFEYERE
jgi:hypothetical protein